MSNIEAINKSGFTGKSWRKAKDYSYAARDMVCSLSLSEIPRAMHAMPLAFVDNSGKYSVVAVLGLVENTNFYVTSNGVWRGSYVPAAFRSYPFLLARNEADQDQMVLCFNKDSGLLLEDDSGLPFFDDEGDLSQGISDITEFLKMAHAGKYNADVVSAVLADLNLIVPWQIELNLGSGKRSVNGLYSISEAALNELSDEDFLKLRESGALPLVYSQLLSMQGMSKLIQFAEAKSQQETVSAPGELNFDGMDENQTISFDNI